MLRALVDPELLFWNTTTPTQQAALRDAIAQWRGAGAGPNLALNACGGPLPVGFACQLAAKGMPQLCLLLLVARF
jgi:hypothetical protein